MITWTNSTRSRLIAAAVTIGALGVASLGGVACSSSTTTTGTPDTTDASDSKNTDEAGAETDAGSDDASTHPDAAGRDAAPPPVAEVEGNPAAPAACDTICGATKRVCVPDYEWSRLAGGKSKAGCHATYVRAATGGAVDTVFGCSDIPPLQKTLANFPRDLERFDCACR